MFFFFSALFHRDRVPLHLEALLTVRVHVNQLLLETRHQTLSNLMALTMSALLTLSLRSLYQFRQQSEVQTDHFFYCAFPMNSLPYYSVEGSTSRLYSEFYRNTNLFAVGNPELNFHKIICHRILFS